MTKYQYYRVIQGNYGYGWDDECFEECDSRGHYRSTTERERMRENLRLYRENGGGVYRVITRRELREQVAA